MIAWHVRSLLRFVDPSLLMGSLFYIIINYFNIGYYFPLGIYDNAGGQMSTEVLVFRGHLSLARVSPSCSLPFISCTSYVKLIQMPHLAMALPGSLRESFSSVLTSVSIKWMWMLIRFS